MISQTNIENSLESHMKKNIVFPVLLLLLATLSNPAFSKDQTEKFLSFNNSTNYKGPFKSVQMFKRNEDRKIWFASKRFQSAREITCSVALATLRENGTWIGNLADNGQCLKPAEAPEWTTGNYLNFLSEKNNKQRKKK